MPNQLTVTYEGSHIQVLSDGDKNFDFSEKLWTSVAEMCQKHNCFNVLGIANTTTPIEAVEGYDHARLFRELNIGQDYRIAWVELNPDAVDIVSFIETVLVNRGLPGRLFPTVEEARNWLLGDDATTS